MRTWFSVKKRIQNKPELIDPYRSVSYSAAKKIWKEQGRPDTWEIMEGARIKAAKTPAEWEALTGISPKAGGRRVATGRRWIAALIILALLATFMACTVPGRALAKAIYQLFTTLVGDVLHVSTQSSAPPYEVIPEQEYLKDMRVELESIEKAYDRINLALFYLKDDKYSLQSIVLSDSIVRGRSLKCIFHLGDMEIYIKQQWPPEKPSLDTFLYIENPEYHTTSTKNGYNYYGFYTEYENNYLGGTIDDPAIIHVNIRNVTDLSVVDEILNDITIYP